MDSLEEFFACDNGPNGRTLRRGQWASDDYHVFEKILKKILLDQRHEFSRTEQLNGKTKTLIPLSIHFIWLGNKPLPRYSSLGSQDGSLLDGCNHLWNETMQSWKNHHPGWKLQLWDERKILKLFGEVDGLCQSLLTSLLRLFRQASESQSYGMASDIARLLILYQCGGVYVDVDYFCVESVQAFHEKFEFYCGASNTGCIEINNGLIGSIPKHPFLLVLLRKISTWFKEQERDSSAKDAPSKSSNSDLHGSLISSFLDTDTIASLQHAMRTYTAMEVITHTGPGLLTRSILEQFRDQQIGRKRDGPISICDMCLYPTFGILKSRVFNPLPNIYRKIGLNAPTGTRQNNSEENASHTLQNFRTNETKAIHLWSCSWQR